MRPRLRDQMHACLGPAPEPRSIGETPDNVRNHPALKGMNIGNTGMNGSVGVAGLPSDLAFGASNVEARFNNTGGLVSESINVNGTAVPIAFSNLEGNISQVLTSGLTLATCLRV